jgi:hypothetical protein
VLDIRAILWWESGHVDYGRCVPLTTRRTKRNPLPDVADASNAFAILEVGAYIAPSSDERFVYHTSATEKLVNFVARVTGVKIAEDLAKLWTNDYLIDRMGERPISVAVTPNGYHAKSVLNADSDMKKDGPTPLLLTTGPTTL